MSEIHHVPKFAITLTPNGWEFGVMEMLEFGLYSENSCRKYS